ncbi:MAG: NRDE family protein, partial [bacterium]|nr:NRDE family protein [bacterium]
MCILAMAWRAHPRWHLVLAGNRDEWHARPAAAIAQWADAPGIIAGRDLQSGGTWLGVAQQGRMAVITNVRNPDGPVPGRVSRGALVRDALIGTGGCEAPYADPAPDALSDFAPFNLIVVDGDQARFLTNRQTPARTILTPGLYGLSNGMLDEPWPKTLQLKAEL